MKKLLLPLLALLGCTYADAQRIKGSDTVLPLTQALSEMYMNEHPSASVTVTGGGSGVGISALMEGTTDLAMASRRIKFSEKMKMKQAKHQPEEVVVAYDALAVIVNPENPVNRLTREQLEGIFRGKSPTGRKWVEKTPKSWSTPAKPHPEPTNSSRKVSCTTRTT